MPFVACRSQPAVRGPHPYPARDGHDEADCTACGCSGTRSATGSEEIEDGLSRSQIRNLSSVAIAALVATILLATLSSLGAGDGGCGLGLTCLTAQFALFAVLGVAIAGRYASSDAARRSPRRVLMMTVLTVWLFAAADELAQEQLHGRGADFGDWVADMAGALAGMVAGGFLLRQATSVIRRR